MSALNSFSFAVKVASYTGHILFYSYYLQHFVDTFRQGVIDLLLGNLDDISDISADDPLEQITQIAQTALVPESRAPSYFNYGVMGNEFQVIEESVVYARLMSRYFFSF